MYPVVHSRCVKGEAVEVYGVCIPLIKKYVYV